MVKQQSVLVSITDSDSKIRAIEYKSKRCGMFGVHWHKINLDEHNVCLMIDHANELACQQNNYGIYIGKDRLWLQIDGDPEFEIEDIRVPGCISYREEMERSHLCPNPS